MGLSDKQVRAGQIRPYGHHLDDGLVQVCFTLPIECGEKAQAAALAYAERMGLKTARVTWMEAIGPNYTYFIIYGESQHALNLADIPEPAASLPRPARRSSELDQEFRRRLGRRAVVLACSDSGSQTAIDFDATLSLKGISGEMGLEGYGSFNLIRERQSQSVDDIVNRLVAVKADALLVCEPTSGWGEGERGLRELSRKLRKCKELPKWFVAVCWRQEPAKAEHPFADYQLCVSRGIAPSRLADLLVEQLCQQGLNPEAAKGDAARSRPKKRFLGIFGRGS